MLSALALLALVACNKDPKVEASQEEMLFGSNIPATNLRVANDAFEANDAIGISMTGGATATNVQYKTTTGGTTATFAPATIGINFEEGQSVNFTAYYPYSAEANTDLAIDLTNAQMDVLYSSNLAGITTPKDASGANHILQFDHKLALVTFAIQNLTSGTTISSAKLEGVITTSSMKIADGTLINGSVSATQMLLLNGDKTNLAPTIVIPASNSNAKLVITLCDGKSYSYTFGNLDFTSGKHHRYNVTLGTGAQTLTVDEVNGQISDWEIIDETPVIVDPDEGGTTPPTPSTGDLFFDGSDFEDFEAFENALNEYGLKDYASQALSAGRDGSAALHINGTPEGNDYVFTVQNIAGKDYSGKTKISYYIKGTAEGKSLSCNVYTGGKSYKIFNVGTVDNADVNVTVSPNNQYTGSITATDWVKVTLDISGLTLPTSGDLFAIKVGKSVAWDLYIDDITIE